MARPRTFEEGRVVRAARQAFQRGGYAATSIDELTAATGLRRSSIYGAFGDKRGLFLRVFEDYCAQQVAAVHEQLDGDDAGALARLTEHMHGLVTNLESSGVGCLLARETAELAGSDAEVGLIAAATFTRYAGCLSECVAAAQRAGDARADLDPAATGTLLLSVLRGLESLARAGHEPARMRAAVDTALTLVSP